MNKFVNISGAIFRDFVKCEQCPECIFVIFNMTKTKKKDDDVARDKWTKGQRLRMAEIYRVICNLNPDILSASYITLVPSIFY